jgi:hypothetical protein
MVVAPIVKLILIFYHLNTLRFLMNICQSCRFLKQKKTKEKKLNNTNTRTASEKYERK